MNTSIEIGFSPKIVKINNGKMYLYFWYANNAGRGSDNCAIIKSGASRAAKSADQADIITETKTSAWQGKNNRFCMAPI